MSFFLLHQRSTTNCIDYQLSNNAIVRAGYYFRMPSFILIHLISLHCIASRLPHLSLSPSPTYKKLIKLSMRCWRAFQNMQNYISAEQKYFQQSLGIKMMWWLLFLLHFSLFNIFFLLLVFIFLFLPWTRAHAHKWSYAQDFSNRQRMRERAIMFPSIYSFLLHCSLLLFLCTELILLFFLTCEWKRISSLSHSHCFEPERLFIVCSWFQSSQKLRW